MSLFELKDFTMHSGGTGKYKIECDTLTEDDWETLAYIVSEKLQFRKVVGIPTGGETFAKALRKYEKEDSDVILIADDVLTTGRSMEGKRVSILLANYDCAVVGVVAFARGECPYWVKPIFQMWD